MKKKKTIKPKVITKVNTEVETRVDTVMSTQPSLINTDPTIYTLIRDENNRQNNGIELIASENYPSKAVLEAQGSILTYKYAEGYPSHRYYGGCSVIDKIEQIAIDRACDLFECKYANVQPHSGSQANMAVYSALLGEGDTILSLDLNSGGHLTHGSSVSFSGQHYNFVHYSLTDNGYIDYADVRDKALKYKPSLIIAGASAYPRLIDFVKFREITDELNSALKREESTHPTHCYLMVDMAHIAGLVAAGVHPSPFPYADVVTSTTHKTLRGPRGGIILCNDSSLAKKIDKAVFPGIQGGPLEHIIAAKAVCFAEAATDSFKEYATNIISNCRAMAEIFRMDGCFLITNGTSNHMILLDTVSSFGITGDKAEEILSKIGITVNKNMIPNDTEKPSVTSGIRIGTAAITTRGASRSDSIEIASLIVSALKHPEILDKSGEETRCKLFAKMYSIVSRWRKV